MQGAGTDTKTWRTFHTVSMKRIMDQLPYNWKCVICLQTKNDVIHQNDMNRAITTVVPCNHSFCFGCLDSWLEHSKRCPGCNEILREIITID